MRAERQEYVEVARRPTAQAGLALAGDADAGAILDAGRNIDRQSAFARGAAGAGTGRARIFDDLAAALAAGARELEREESLGMAETARAAAMRADFRLGAGLGAGAGAILAGD